MLDSFSVFLLDHPSLLPHLTCFLCFSCSHVKCLNSTGVAFGVHFDNLKYFGFWAQHRQGVPSASRGSWISWQIPGSCGWEQKQGAWEVDLGSHYLYRLRLLLLTEFWKKKKTKYIFFSDQCAVIFFFKKLSILTYFLIPFLTCTATTITVFS